MKIQAFWRTKRLWLVAKICFRCALLAMRGKQTEIPTLLYMEFRKLGGIYIKFLQLLVLRSHMFQVLNKYDLYEVYDQVTYDQIDIKKLLASELGSAAGKLQLKSNEPFAAGSFGQVYLARHADKDVIIKVLRPSVLRTLSFDLKVLHWVSAVVDIFSIGGAISTSRLCKELAKATRAETNYILEADYAATLHKRYENHQSIYIPYTFRELSTKHVICQEYVGGIAATDLLRVVKQGIDPETYIRQTIGSNLHAQLVAFGSEILTSVFRHGVTYGDPHPGNVKFLPNNKVGLIDYGLQAPAPSNMSGFYALIEQYYNIYHDQFDMRSYSQAILEMYGGDIIKAAKSLDEYFGSDLCIVDGMVSVAEQKLHQQSSEIRYLLDNNKMMALFGSIINKNNQFCLRYELDGPELMRASNLCIALVSELGMKKAVLKEIYEIVMDDIQHIRIETTDTLLHPETAFEILASWLDQISYKNPQLHRHIMQGRLSHV